MKVLTDESLNESIKLCQENECYRVLIVTKYIGDQKFILDYLSQTGADVIRCFGRPWARFLNGSSINIISTASTIRGYKADLVLYQAGVIGGDDVMMSDLAAAEIANRNFKLFKDEV